MLRIELTALYAFALILPMLEAPKNLLWVAYVTLWLVNRFRARNFGGPWNAWDTMILAWVASGYCVAVFAGIHNSEWLSAFDILRYGSVLWMLKRSGYGADSLHRLLFCILAGTAAALARGGYELWISKIHSSLGLNSVGHVNHSAIYLAIAFIAALAWLRAAWSTVSPGIRLAGLFANAAFAAALFVMASRAAVGVAFVAATGFLLIYAARTRKNLGIVILSAIVVAALVIVARPDVVEKNQARLKENLFLAYRDGIWLAGLEAWRQFPAFGVGMGNFGKIDKARLEAWSKERGETFHADRINLASHGHSLYVNTLAERGTIGLATLLTVLGAWGYGLVRGIPQPTESAVRWAYWGGSFGALLVAAIVGLVNTTLHHEHALISMLLLGGWLSLQEAKRESP